MCSLFENRKISLFCYNITFYLRDDKKIIEITTRNKYFLENKRFVKTKTVATND